MYYASFGSELIVVHTVASSVTPSFCSESSLRFLRCFRQAQVHSLSCHACWVHGLVFPETASSSFISEAEPVRGLIQLRLSSHFTVAFTIR